MRADNQSTSPCVLSRFLSLRRAGAYPCAYAPSLAQAPISRAAGKISDFLSRPNVVVSDKVYEKNAKLCMYGVRWACDGPRPMA